MIVVNKFELYRQYACKLNYNHLTTTITNTVIVNRFNYDFNITGGGGTFVISNTQQFFVNNKTNLFFQQNGETSSTGYVVGFLPTFVNTNTYNFYTLYTTAALSYQQSWSAFLTLQVYF